MATTFLQLREIIAEDLAGEVAQDDAIVARAVKWAIKRYESDHFLFNEGSDTVDTVAGTTSYDLSVSGTDMVSIASAVIQDAGARVPLVGPVQFGEFHIVEPNVTPNQSKPRIWAYREGTFRIYPCPDAVYTIEYAGLVKLAPLSADGDANIWTHENHGQELIVAAATSFILSRYLKDPENAAIAQSDAEMIRRALLSRVNAKAPVKSTRVSI